MVHYNEYLRLNDILGAQAPESDRLNRPAHDEMLFIIIHQAYELWFRQILHEIQSVRRIMQNPAINDNSPELQTVVHRLARVVTILKVLVHQVDIMETMTPMDFLEFRDLLRPASGFQSWQFKIIEASLGLKYENRHGQEYYLSQLNDREKQLIRDAESDRSLLVLLNQWLERMPFSDEERKWTDYKKAFVSSLADAEHKHAGYLQQVFEESGEGMLSPTARRAALFIMLYRGYPILQLPFQLLNNLLEIDEQLSTWRYRHMNMVHRMIGTRIGTGGSSGKEYLKGAADKHFIFGELGMITGFLIDRKHLPPLDRKMEARLGFAQI